MKRTPLKLVCPILLAAALLLCACTPTKTPDGTNSEENTQQEISFLELIGGEQNTCRIVYPMMGSQTVHNAMASLKNGIKERCGTEAITTADSLADKGDLPTILLGTTSAPESAQAQERLQANSFSVSVINGTVVIVATNDSLLQNAVEQFLTLCVTGTGSLKLPSNTAYFSEQFEECVIVSNGSAEYSIVYAAADENAKLTAQSLQRTIRNVTGVTLDVLPDTSDVREKEILIGDTDRKISRTNAVGYLNYRIAYDQSTGKITLTGYFEEALNMFTSIINESGSEGELSVLPASFGQGTLKGYGYIPLFTGGNLVATIRSDMNSYYVHYENTSPKLFRNYLTTLESEGFRKYTEREVNGNLFATYTDGTNILNIGYLDAFKSIQIAADTVENSFLPSLENECTNAVTTPQLTQINGADSFLFRLSDGRFIVVDGGLASQKPNWQVLAEQLKAQNVLDGKPVIAAWFLSHPHSDHYGGFIGFASNGYAEEVELQSVVLNLPTKDTYSVNVEAAGTTEGIERVIATAKSILNTFYPDTKLLIPHAGQVFWFGDAMIEMLYTQETLTPNPMKVTNSSSLAYTITIAGQRIALLNDAHDDMSEIIYKLYGDTLKCDIVQVAHHGYNGGHAGMYACIAADTALWTSPLKTTLQILEAYGSRRNHFDPNSVKENLLMDVNDLNVADETSVMIIPLPHAVGSLPAYVRVLTIK